MRTRTEDGYALLAALVVITLAALFAATAVAAVTADHCIAAADRGSSRADAAAWQALDEQAERLRRRPWLADPPLSVAAWRSLAVQAQGEARSSRSVLSAVLELRLPSWCGGLVTGGDAQLEAPVTVVNCGACIGGCLRGREWLTFAPAPQAAGASGPADLVRGPAWSICAVHALGGVWANGFEVHEARSGEVDQAYAADTDTHTGEEGVTAITEGPGAALLAALREQAVAPGAALDDDVLDVSLLPGEAPGATGTDPAVAAAGYVVVLPAGGTPVRIVGERDPGACPLAVIVQGDVIAGDVGVALSLRGALVVCGRLDVAGASEVDGSLFAGSLVTAAPLTITAAPDWRAHPLAGLATPVIVRLARG